MGACSRMLVSEKTSLEYEIMVFPGGRKVKIEPHSLFSALSTSFKLSSIQSVSTWKKKNSYVQCETTQRNKVKIKRGMHKCVEQSTCQGKFPLSDTGAPNNPFISCKHSPASTNLKLYLFFFILPFNPEPSYQIWIQPVPLQGSSPVQRHFLVYIISYSLHLAISFSFNSFLSIHSFFRTVSGF